MMRSPLALAGALLLGGALAACKTTAPLPTATVNGQLLTLPYQQAVALPIGGASASLAFTELSDSRCPSGGQCIWAGEARVALVLTAGPTAPQTLRLGLGAGPRRADSLPDSLPLTLSQRPYWLRLLAVAPYPALAGTPPGPAVVTLRLRPQ